MKIGILGAAGRMGQMLVREVAAGQGIALAGAADMAGHAAIGKDAGQLAGLSPLGVVITQDVATLFATSDVVIDFTLPAATAAHVKRAAETKTPIVIGTTGLGPAETKAITEAAASVAIVQAPNMSLAVNLLLALTRKAASVFDDSYDVAISEMHHRHKVDAPSGTALALRDAVETGGRKRDEITMTAIRAGDLAGEHSVFFIGEGEQLALTHEATSRSVFARGAVHAARWVLNQPPGRYGMQDVLGLD
ncbi:MAG: 4-hydroxy-tetrahydrodipicolinate reductase [Alphaproteobacteria bacterium]|nr:4-hydroxy-tetrahydrodipicolinate reductase [Alphaproteobacteria bacterium]